MISEHLLGEPCWVIHRALSFRDPREEGGQARVPSGRRAASALPAAPGRGLWKRVSSATWRLARSIWGSRGQPGSQGASWACKSLLPLPPPPPPLRLREAQCCPGAGWRHACLRTAGLHWSRPSSKAWQGATRTPQGGPAHKHGRGHSKEATSTGERTLCFLVKFLFNIFPMINEPTASLFWSRAQTQDIFSLMFLDWK